ncbi:sensor histidine kinase [Desertivirga xinjiangensis]|uniref:sensor histidine kinase n=1 Tax=Desertivirga xinjiangensis TaxID=539206 RepID=UPI00210939DE|nr:HAMP domain-containing sensor histidine kinase [Pedobacter xinjiangensis]
MLQFLTDTCELDPEVSDFRIHNEKLLELNASKDKFFSIIAHDLRNPVSSLKMLTQFLAEDLEQNNMKGALELSAMLSAQVDHTYALLNNLLDWSRAQSGNISLKRQVLFLKDVFESEVSINQIVADSKYICITGVADENLVINADANMLNTILRNLITNAIKFSYEHGWIMIKAEERPDDILVTVEDCGRGMTSDILENLFIPHTKTSTPGTNNESGTGLGLLLCKEFVELHGGRIWAESEPEIGSKFYFTLSR